MLRHEMEHDSRRGARDVMGRGFKYVTTYNHDSKRLTLSVATVDLI